MNCNCATWEPLQPGRGNIDFEMYKVIEVRNNCCHHLNKANNIGCPVPSAFFNQTSVLSTRREWSKSNMAMSVSRHPRLNLADTEAYIIINGPSTSYQYATINCGMQDFLGCILLIIHCNSKGLWH